MRKNLYINMLGIYIFYTDKDTDFKIICINKKKRRLKKRIQIYRTTDLVGAVVYFLPSFECLTR